MANLSVYRCILLLFLFPGTLGFNLESKKLEKSLMALVERLREFTDKDNVVSDIHNRDSEQDKDDAEKAWEHSRMIIVNGKTEKHVDGYKPWLNLPPEQTNGQTDEVLSHAEKVRLNLEGEADEEDDEDDIQKRKFIYPKGDNRLWPQGIIPYTFATGTLAFNNPASLDEIKNTMRWYESNTCIRWVPASSSVSSQVGHDSYVEFQTGTGCRSHVGRNSGGNPKRELTLKEPNCVSFSTIAHEMGHTLGLHHEHVRDDRDNYVEIVWSRVPEQPGGVNWGKVDTFNYAPYDLGSVMHYNLYAGSTERGKKAIISKNAELDFLASTRQQRTMSFYDVLSINFVYSCADNCASKPECENGGFVNKECQCVCPDGLTGNLCQHIVTDGNCGGIIDLKMKGKAKISSPYSPSPYEIGADCGWLIRGPELSLIKLTFTSFDIPVGRGFNRFTGQTEDVCVHHLEVRYNLIGQPGPRYCGKDWKREPVKTTIDGESNMMMIRFNSKLSHETGTGFRAVITTVPIGCLSSPCQNGGSCKDKRKGPSCACPAGYTGAFCQLIGGAKIYCDMDDFATCPFDNDQTSELEWKLQEGATLSPNTGPVSGQNGSGQYIYMEASNVPINSVARLASALMKPYARCLKFYYNMHGRNMGDLHVKTLEDGEERVIFSVVGDQGEGWKYQTMTVRGKKPFRIIFEATRGTNYQSDIALDSVSVQLWKCRDDETPVVPPVCGSRPCENKGICMKEVSGPKCVCPTGFVGQYCELVGDTNISCFFGRWKKCLFNIEQNGSMIWKTNTGKTNTDGTGPDKGMGGKGAYLYVDASEGTEGQKTRFISELLDDSPRCLKFNYHMFGSTMGSLEVSIERGQSSIPLFSKSGDMTNKWRRQRMTVESSEPYRLVFTATRGNGELSDIAIDSLKLTYPACGQKPPKPTKASSVEIQTFDGETPVVAIRDQVTCDFDDETFCKFSQQGDSGWLIKHGPSSDQSTGPRGDHTGKGCYLALEKLDSQGQAQEVSIISEAFNFGNKESICVTFWFHIDGTSPGSLSLVAKANNQDETVWTSNKSVSRKWRQVKVTIKSSSFQLQFTGKTSDNDGPLGLDDVTIKPGQCHSNIRAGKRRQS